MSHSSPLCLQIKPLDGRRTNTLKHDKRANPDFLGLVRTRRIVAKEKLSSLRDRLAIELVELHDFGLILQ